MARSGARSPTSRSARGPRDRYRKTLNQPSQGSGYWPSSKSPIRRYPFDRGIKWHGYAAAGVPVYWIVDLTRRSVEVYTDPTGQGETAEYHGFKSYGEGDRVPVVIEGQELGTIAVKDILP